MANQDSFEAISAQHLPPPGTLNLDHVGHFVPDKDAASAVLEKLGFSLTPFSLQTTKDAAGESVPAGTGNRCAMFASGYLEFLTPVADTPVANADPRRDRALHRPPPDRLRHARCGRRARPPRTPWVRALAAGKPAARSRCFGRAAPRAFFRGPRAPGNHARRPCAVLPAPHAGEHVAAEIPRPPERRHRAHCGLRRCRRTGTSRRAFCALRGPAAHADPGIRADENRAWRRIRRQRHGVQGVVRRRAPAAPAMAGYALACKDPLGLRDRLVALGCTVSNPSPDLFAACLPAAIGSAWLFGTPGAFQDWPSPGC